MGIWLEQLAVSYTTLAEHRTTRSGVASSEEICSKQENGLQTRGQVSGNWLNSKREQITWTTCVWLGKILWIWYSHSQKVLRLFCGDKIISRGFWPPRSADLNTCEFFFFVGNVEGWSARYNTRDEGILEEGVWEVAFSTWPAEPRRAMNKVFGKLPFQLDQQNLDVQWTRCLLDVTRVSEKMETPYNIFS